MRPRPSGTRRRGRSPGRPGRGAGAGRRSSRPGRARRAPRRGGAGGRPIRAVPARSRGRCRRGRGHVAPPADLVAGHGEAGEDLVGGGRGAVGEGGEGLAEQVLAVREGAALGDEEARAGAGAGRGPAAVAARRPAAPPPAVAGEQGAEDPGVDAAGVGRVVGTGPGPGGRTGDPGPGRGGAAPGPGSTVPGPGGIIPGPGDVAPGPGGITPELGDIASGPGSVAPGSRGVAGGRVGPVGRGTGPYPAPSPLPRIRGRRSVGASRSPSHPDPGHDLAERPVVEDPCRRDAHGGPAPSRDRVSGQVGPVAAVPQVEPVVIRPQPVVARPRDEHHDEDLVHGHGGPGELHQVVVVQGEGERAPPAGGAVSGRCT